MRKSALGGEGGWRTDAVTFPLDTAETPGVHDTSEALLSHWLPPNPDKPALPHKNRKVSKPKKCTLGSSEVTPGQLRGFASIPTAVPVHPGEGTRPLYLATLA